MANHSIGIRKKITYGFYMLLVLMVGTAVLTYGIVRQVEEKVVFVEVIEDFFNATLEVRRFEKNYFLYRQEKDFLENQLYWQKLLDLFLSKTEALQSIVSSDELERIANIIASYKGHMARLHEFNLKGGNDYKSRFRNSLEDQVRRAGKELTDFAEKTRLAEKTEIKRKLKTTQSFLLWSILCLFVFGVVVAALLGRKVVSSLKVLEGYTKRISQGNFVEIAVLESEQEIRSLLLAFNRMTRELQMRQQQLVQSEKLAALGTLLSGVAHELNNPLSNISSSAQILGEEIEGDDLEFKKNLVDQIETQSDKARDIVRTLLEFSRIKEFNKQRLLLGKLIAETILLMRGQVPSEVEIMVEVPDDLEILADKQRLQQVFLNLIKNGIDAMDGQGHLWLTARKTEKYRKRGEVEIMIEDDGPGIDSELMNRIFDPFFTTKDVGKGSGLGLYVVHDIVEWHGGTINVDSRPGVGTTFTIWLPGEEQED